MAELMRLAQRAPEAQTEAPEREERERPPYCATKTMRAIHRLFDACRTVPSIGIVIGAPGVGKSAAVHMYGGANMVTVCTLTAVTAEPRPFLKHLARCLSTGYHGATATEDLYENVVRQIRMYGVRLLIVDEAGYAGYHVLDAIRDLHDRTNVGVAMVGNDAITDALLGRGAGAKYANRNQFQGRVSREITIPAPLPEDLDAICAHWGIECEPSRKIVRSVGARGGNLRAVRYLFEFARRLAGEDGRLTTAALRDAATALGVAS